MSTDEKTIVSVIGTESVLSGDLHVDYNNQDYSHNKNIVVFFLDVLKTDMKVRR